MPGCSLNPQRHPRRSAHHIQATVWKLGLRGLEDQRKVMQQRGRLRGPRRQDHWPTSPSHSGE